MSEDLEVRKKTRLRWLKDPKAENNLRGLGIRFEVVTGIALSNIDRQEGMRRQVRLGGKLTETTVFTYATAMEKDGAAFPMPILQKERRVYWPWSGNHRLASYDLSDTEEPKTVDAYVVEVHDPVMQDLLPRLVNTWEAVVGMSREEAVINARYMVDRHSMGVTEAAKLFGVRPEQIYRHGVIEEMKKRVASLGVPTNGFASIQLEKMHTISNLNALRGVAALLHENKVKGEEALAIINDVRKASTEAQQLSELDKWKKVYTDRKKVLKDKAKKATVKLPHKQVQRDRLIKLITGLKVFAEVNKTLTQAQLTDPADQKLLLEAWKVIHPWFINIIQER